MQAALFIDEPAWNDRHRRLAVCMAISALGMFLGIVLLDWPMRLDLPRLVPLELEITIRKPPDAREAEARELPTPRPAPAPVEGVEPVTPAVAPPAAPEQAAEPVEQAAGAERAAVSTPGLDAPAARVDWYAELERAAAEVGARESEAPKSMHPVFDELRRIAALRYGKRQTNPPPPTWEAGKDPYGRTLLKRGNTFMILEDRRLFNRYAFETFEKHMMFVEIPLGRAPPKNLPWVDTIRARYEYLREPDELPPLKTTTNEPASIPR